MSDNIISKLKANINYLTNTEKKIAAIILESPNEFITYTMQELAKKTNVSQGSIINFSKKFACGGFPELKIQIATSALSEPVAIPEVVKSGDTITDVLSKMIEARNSSFELTRQVNNEETWKRVIDKIIAAKKIEIYGIFQSATVATSLCYNLMQLGISASFVSDILTCAISATMLDKNSLVIAISSSGRTKDILDAVKNARFNNVPVIAITSNINSPLAKISDDVLIASTSNSIMEAYASGNLIADTICAYIKSTLRNEAKNKYFNINRILSSHSVEESEDETIS